MTKTCRTCRRPIGSRNKSGYCRAHVSAAMAADPAHREKQRAGIKRKLAADPTYLDGLRKRARALSNDPEINAKRSAIFVQGRYWEIGTEVARDPAIRLKAARASSATKLAWCPAHLRDHYRFLVNSKRMKAAEARAIIMDQHEAEMRRWRAEVRAA